ncbi:MAG: hypothetical protein ABEH90_09210 [Halolamina sp.]
MRGSLALLTEEAGDLLLIASLLTIGPAWVGGIEILSALGIDGGAAAFLSGAYAWGRGALSAALLVKHARRGSLAFGVSLLTRVLEPVARQSPFTRAYPTPAVNQFTLSSTPHVA